jgi:hypothetical protein
MHYAVHPCSSASRWQCDSVTEPLDKYASPAGCPDTSKPARLNIDLDNSTVGGQIHQASLVAAMDPARDGTAFGAGPYLCAQSRRYDDLCGSDFDAIKASLPGVSFALCVLRHIFGDSPNTLNHRQATPPAHRKLHQK